MWLVLFVPAREGVPSWGFTLSTVILVAVGLLAFFKVA
jgi:hypothetical protein